MSTEAQMRCDGCGELVHVLDVISSFDEEKQVMLFFCPACYEHRCGGGEDGVEANVN